MVRDADGGNGGEGTVRRKGRGLGDWVMSITYARVLCVGSTAVGVPFS
jgi:hypothetical protein